jgi:hypothetical protein
VSVSNSPSSRDKAALEVDYPLDEERSRPGRLSVRKHWLPNGAPNRLTIYADFMRRYGGITLDDLMSEFRRAAQAQGG